MIEINIVIKDNFEQIKITCLREQPSLNAHTMDDDDCYNKYLGYGEKKKNKY